MALLDLFCFWKHIYGSDKIHRSTIVHIFQDVVKWIKNLRIDLWKLTISCEYISYFWFILLFTTDNTSQGCQKEFFPSGIISVIYFLQHFRWLLFFWKLFEGTLIGCENQRKIVTFVLFTFSGFRRVLTVEQLSFEQ